MTQLREVKSVKKITPKRKKSLIKRTDCAGPCGYITWT